MKMLGRGSVAFAALAVGVGAALAMSGAEAIKERRALMKDNGEATKPVIAMLKGAPFDLATVQKALATYENAAAKMPGLFPSDSQAGDTHALAAVWTDTADFDARFKKLGADSAAASGAIVDAATFKANIMGVLKNCQGCHETYRAKES
ncbi:cytochrome c556 [Roseiarcus fermentans]|uniref:Cytochrome c556 n=1 Tax=Roseiarcus fermentans TaxID=1473586 RepID=A0A366FP89_9HYPH|nr:cytochrome c [Roseiarcus fermentans]RBP16367.1 cytochrome c556 [Roseiarcus fermentans]